MGGGLESRCVGRVCGADGADPHRTHDLSLQIFFCLVKFFFFGKRYHRYGTSQYMNVVLNTADIHSSVSPPELTTSILLHDDAGDTKFMNLVLLRTKGFFHIGASIRVHRKSNFCCVTLWTSSSASSYTQREFISALKYSKVKSSLIRGNGGIDAIRLAVSNKSIFTTADSF